MSKITIVDYANGNAKSVLRALHSIGASAIFSKNKRDIADSDYLILPGVGHAGTAMASLQADHLVEPLRDAVFGRRTPVLGICLGMHLMVDHIEEGDCAGLGWVKGRAVSLTVRNRLVYKVPHIGWNTVGRRAGSRLSPDLPQDDPSYYFCHKYVVEGVGDVEAATSFHYESDRLAAFERDNIFGVQFHPEKSHESGQDLFRSFLNFDR